MPLKTLSPGKLSSGSFSKARRSLFPCLDKKKKRVDKNEANLPWQIKILFFTFFAVLVGVLFLSIRKRSKNSFDMPRFIPLSEEIEYSIQAKKIQPFLEMPPMEETDDSRELLSKWSSLGVYNSSLIDPFYMTNGGSLQFASDFKLYSDTNYTGYFVKPSIFESVIKHGLGRTVRSCPSGYLEEGFYLNNQVQPGSRKIYCDGRVKFIQPS